MALHLMSSPSRRLLLKGVLKCLTLRSIVRLITWWEVRGGDRTMILPCAAAASSLLHDIGPITGWPAASCTEREGGWETANDRNSWLCES